MDDYASAIFVAIIEAALRRQGIEVADQAPPPAGQRIALARKRRLLEAVLAAHGPAPLLQVGLGLDAVETTPVAALFRTARDPHDLLQRWLRLERYFHSRHRTRVLAHGESSLLLEHFARAGPAPGLGENLVVAALLAALADWIGAGEVTLAFAGPAGEQVVLRDGQVREISAVEIPGLAARCRLGWSAMIVRPTAPAAVSLPARAANGADLSDPWVARVFAGFLAAPGRKPSLAGCAADLALSPRSLQRRLAAAGSGFQQVIGQARLHVAAELLRANEAPLAVVGLLAGYADQAHFNRAFRAGMGPTPKVYRDLARAARGGQG